MISMDPLEQVDPAIAGLIRKDVERQNSHIHLIASENFASPAVMAASGSVFTNKYAEGYPGRRYYEGCAVVDEMEQLAIDRAKELFGAEHANVQAHSGAQANMGVYFSLLQPGDRVLGMRLDQGGHLTHGSPVNFSGLYYDFVAYGVDRETELVDMDQVRASGHRAQAEHRPGRLLGLLPHPGLRGVPGDRRRGGRSLHGRCGPFHRSGGGAVSPFARAPRRHRHRDHPQGPAWPAGWPDPQQRALCQGHRPGDLPQCPGRAHRIADRGQGGLFPRGDAARVPRLHRPDRDQRQGDGGGDPGSRECGWSRAAPTTTSS